MVQKENKKRDLIQVTSKPRKKEKRKQRNLYLYKFIKIYVYVKITDKDFLRKKFE